MITPSNPLYRIFSTSLPLFVIFVASNWEGVSAESTEQTGTDFNREIRPILSDHCFACHGPDEHDRKADLRLDTTEGLRSILSEEDDDRGFILDRIHSEDSDILMPPPEFQKPLTSNQKRTIEKWLQLGATIERPWAFTTPQKPIVPEDIEQDSQSIDYFIQERIKANGLIKNPPAKPSE
ncbi:MAG: c-type cytochrome domain-containing protein, partial [Planctomycetota bacterium]|nr:c-type cytochrome domain-containing protein [Planctomycetota bacterium]